MNHPRMLIRSDSSTAAGNLHRRNRTPCLSQPTIPARRDRRIVLFWFCGRALHC